MPSPWTAVRQWGDSRPHLVMKTLARKNRVHETPRMQKQKANYKPNQNPLEKHGSSMDRRRFVVAGVEVGFGVVAGSLMPTATSIAQATLNPRKEQTSTSSPSNTNQTARIFITGSADGLGHAAAKTLLADGYQVVVHVRSEARLTAVQDLVDQGAIRDNRGSFRLRADARPRQPSQ